MNKREFLQKLGEYLIFELPESMVEKNVEYYDSYIDQEAKNGKSVKEVLDDLGDPQLIARSIIDAAKSGCDGIPNTGDDMDFSGEIYGQASERRTYTEDPSSGCGQRGKVFDEDGSSSGHTSDSRTAGGGFYGGSQGQNTGSGKPGGSNGFGGIHVYSGGCFTGILILLIIFAVFSVIGTIIGLLSPVLIPLCIIMLIIWLIRRR